MAEGALRLRDKTTGNIVNYQPGSSYDQNQYEEVKDSPAYVMAPSEPSPFVESVIPSAPPPGVNVAQTPPAMSPLPAPTGTPSGELSIPPVPMAPGGAATELNLDGFQGQNGMPYQGPGMAPSGLSTTTETAPGFKVPAKLQREQAAIEKSRMEAAEAGTQLGIAKATESEAFAKEKALIVESQTQTMKDLEDRKQAGLSKILADQEERQKAADNATVDPGRFFANKGTLAQVGAAFAVAMGAYSSAMTGQKNYALDIVNDAIDKDIMAQKEAKAGANDAVKRGQAEFENARQIYGDEALAKESIHIQKLTAVAANWEARAAKFGSEEQRVKGLEKANEIREDANARKIKFAEMAADKVKTSAGVAMAPTVPKSMMDEKLINQSNKLRTEYESDPTRVEGVASINNAGKVKDLLVSAKAGNVEAAAALKSLWARYVNGPGVLTDTDFNRAKLAGGVFQTMASKLSKGLFGELTDEELGAVGRVEGLFRTAGHRLIAKVAKDKIGLSQRYGISSDLVVSSPEERNLALQDEKPSPGKAAEMLGMKVVKN